MARSGYVYKISDPDGPESESDDMEKNILKNILIIVKNIQNIKLYSTSINSESPCFPSILGSGHSLQFGQIQFYWQSGPEDSNLAL